MCTTKYKWAVGMSWIFLFHKNQSRGTVKFIFHVAYYLHQMDNSTNFTYSEKLKTNILVVITNIAFKL